MKKEEIQALVRDEVAKALAAAGIGGAPNAAPGDGGDDDSGPHGPPPPPPPGG